MIQPGTIFVPRGSKAERGQPRVVVRRTDAHGGIFYDGLAHHGGGAICCGHESEARFLDDWQPVARMTFAGAWKMYKREEARRLSNRWWIKHAVDLLTRNAG